MQTKNEMINRIAELAEEVEQRKQEYEVLDACLELAQGKIAELKAENEKLTSWLASSEKEKKKLCNVIHKKKEQIQTMKYMLFDEKEIPKDKFTMYYRIAQNERRTKSHRDLCTNVVKKYRQTLQEIENVLSWVDSSNVWYNGQKAYMGDELIEFLKSRIINIINSTKAEEE